MTVASAARLIPLIRLTKRDAPTTIAPVLPAETKASPSPEASIFMPTAIVQSSYDLTTSVGSTSTGMTFSTSVIEMRSSGIRFFWHTSRMIFSLPQAMMSTPYSFTAMAQPLRTSSGALSPPKASTMILMIIRPPVLPAGPPAGGRAPARRSSGNAAACPAPVRRAGAAAPYYSPSAGTRRRFHR